MRGTPAPIGRFCYHEVATSDVPGAQGFYGGLFGWTFEAVPSSLGGYHLIRHQGELLGGMYAQSEAQAACGSHWVAYVRVEDVDALAAKLPELGGEALAGPFDVAGVGRMLVFRDPAGAVLCLWQSAGQPGATIREEPGSVCWMELVTTDAEGARAFYGALLGWPHYISTGLGIAYTEFQHEGQSFAGMMAMDGPEWEGIPPHWTAYVQVEACDATAASTQELGGGILVPPTDIPTVGRFAVLRDPQGAAFAVLEMAGC